MQAITAIYSGGVFKPLTDVNLPENTQVHLQIESIHNIGLPEWFKQAQEYQQRLLQKYGEFPDSTPGIAEDRRR